MGKVVLLVNVELAADAREEYLAATGELKSRLQQMDGVDYCVYESGGKGPHTFTEMFTFDSADTYEAFDDNDDDTTKDLFARITDLASRPPRYTTLYEVG